ncbi:hypothetical protein NL108_011816 [Boleophthalmus pectinirostris]|nr:hypothetical protein NL108_011816 [Boleophthalmus pectinirostris]
MAVQLMSSVLLIALLTGGVSCVPLGLHKPYTQGSGPAPVWSNVREGVYGMPQSQTQRPEPSQNPPPAPSQPADPGYMAEDPLSSLQPQGGIVGPFPPMPPPLPLPQQFQAGELYQIEGTHDFGNFLRESIEHNLAVAPPDGGPLGGPMPYDSLNSQYGPTGGFIGSWSIIPYDYEFLTGQYPKGTLSYQSSSFEHGGNHYNDVHYSNVPGLGSVRYPVFPNLMWFTSGNRRESPPTREARRAISTVYS